MKKYEWKKSAENAESLKLFGDAINLEVFFNEGWRCSINWQVIPYKVFDDIEQAKERVLSHFHELLIEHLETYTDLGKVKIFVHKDEMRKWGLSK